MIKKIKFKISRILSQFESDMTWFDIDSNKKIKPETHLNSNRTFVHNRIWMPVRIILLLARLVIDIKYCSNRKVEISLEKHTDNAYFPSIISFLYRIRSKTLPFEHLVLGGNEKLWRIFFLIKLSLSWEWHDTYHENLYYKLFSSPPINTVNKKLWIILSKSIFTTWDYSITFILI